MGRKPCCSKESLKRGAWTSHEDKLLAEYITNHGQGKWSTLPKNAGLNRCGKSCRLRWLNYLRPDIKRGNISKDEEDLIIRLHKLLGNRWSLIAGRLPGRTDNEIKNFWNTTLRKQVSKAGGSKLPEKKNRVAENPPRKQPTRSEGGGISRTKALHTLLPNQTSKQIMSSQKDFPAGVQVNDDVRPSSDVHKQATPVVDFGLEEVCMGEIIGDSYSKWLIHTSNEDYYHSRGGDDDYMSPNRVAVYLEAPSPSEERVADFSSFFLGDPGSSFLVT